MTSILNRRPLKPRTKLTQGSEVDDTLGPHAHSAREAHISPEVLLAGYGNSAGDKIESGLSPVGKPVGKGLETVARPVGGLVEPLVGGLMKGSKAWGDALGVGAGNEDKRKTEEEMKSKEPIGGKDQTADNPLGL